MLDKIKQWNWKYVITGFLLLCVVLGLFLGRGLFRAYDVDEYNDLSGEVGVLPASQNGIVQTFWIRSGIEEINLLMQNDSGAPAVLHAQMTDDAGNVLSSCTVEVADSGGAEAAVKLGLSTAEMEDEKSVMLSIWLEQEQPGVSFCVQTGAYEEQLMQNGAATGSRLRMSVVYGSSLNIMALLLMGAAACIVVLLIVIPRRFASPEYLFAILAVTFGVYFAFVNPPLQECDGLSHLYRAMDVSYGNVLAPFVTLNHEEGVCRIPQNVPQSFYTLGANSGAGGRYVEALQSTRFSDEVVEMPFYDNIPFYAYLPQALGLWLGRSLGLSIYACIVLSRLFNLLTYTVIVFFAIRKMPFFRNLFAMLAVMPLSLYQAASGSQDAMQHALCFLFIALCCSYAFDEKRKTLTWKHALGLGVLLLAMFVIKYVYVCLGLLVFMIPMKRFGDRKRYWTAFAVALLPLVLIGGYHVLRVAPGISNVQAVSAASDMTQSQYLMAHPLYLPKVLAKTVVTMGWFYLQSLSVLGSLNCDLSLLFVLLPCFLTAVALLDMDVPESGRIFTVRNRILIMAAAIVTAVLIMVGLYIGDGVANPVGADIVSGVQGRYFIVLLILPFMALKSNRIRQNVDNLSLKCSGVMGVMLLYAALIVFRNYY
ncbi:MAG: DUF2142 domain-containing protein [Lachnospiraceae bacterium]|nr:DUF2142 domain-containing protein [Lachnospiraceae bacterium]